MTEKSCYDVNGILIKKRGFMTNLALQSLNNISPASTSLNPSPSGFSRYIKEIQKFPMLTAEQEYEYGVKLQKNNDSQAAKKLIQSHLRLVVKMAGKFKNYGLPMVDLVSEGNLGLVQAVKKFDPEKGFRLSTYAMWWIRAFMQDYILRSWSLVKIGTTVAQKKLFFNLHKIKRKLLEVDNNQLNPEQISEVSNILNLSNKEVAEMDSRLSQSDTSLNNLISANNDSEKELCDTIESHDPSQEELAIHNQEKSRQEQLFYQAYSLLNEREKDILQKRQMSEKAMTLEEISKIYNVSRERIRQIEENAINKIKKEVRKLSRNTSIN